MTAPKLSPARRAVLERRAAAARRRAILSFALLLATVVLAVIGATTAFSGWFALIPAMLLGTVLTLGRKAVIANQRNDAAWAARAHAKATYRPREMSETERRLAGRPAPAVRTSSGNAAREDVSTTVISRVESSMFAKKHVTGRPVSNGVKAQPQAATKARSSASARSAASPAEQARIAPTPAKADTANNAQQSAWRAAPVPPPVYAAKAAAPKWEAPGITTHLQQITKERIEEIAREASIRETTAESPEQATAQAAHENSDASAHTTERQDTAGNPDSLGVSLNSILAKRRAV